MILTSIHSTTIEALYVKTCLYYDKTSMLSWSKGEDNKKYLTIKTTNKEVIEKLVQSVRMLRNTLGLHNQDLKIFMPTPNAVRTKIKILSHVVHDETLDHALN